MSSIQFYFDFLNLCEFFFNFANPLRVGGGGGEYRVRVRTACKSGGRSSFCLMLAAF